MFGRDVSGELSQDLLSVQEWSSKASVVLNKIMICSLIITPL